MHVGIPIENNFPEAQEVRARRFARAFDAAGHDVTILARNTATDEEREAARRDPPRERLAYATVRRFSLLFGTPLHALLTLPVPVNPLWVVWLLVECRRADVDALVVGGIRVSVPAIVAGRLLGVPVAVDVRENYAEWARTLPKESLADRVQTDPRLVGAVERLSVRLADAVFVVVEERREGLVAEGVDPGKVHVVGNTPDLAEATEFDALAADGDGTGDDVPDYDWPGFAMVYLGYVQELRGLDTLVEAVPYILEAGEEVHLVVGGEGDHKPTLEALVRERGLEEYVHFAGWVEPEHGPAFLASGDVGVIPHRLSPFTHTTVPNKLFDYMLVGLPVLATAMRPVERIVTEEECGRIIPEGTSPAEVAEVVVDLKRGDRERMGANGRRAVEERYNWSRDAGRLVDVVERLAA